MSEITKLYENAGLSNMWVERYNDGYYEHERYYNSYKEMINNMMKANDWTLTEAQEVAKRECKKEHPPFTAEKQIAILMFILNKFGDIGFQKMYSIRGNDESTRKDFIKCLCDCEHETFDSRPVDFYYQNSASGDNLEESLVGLINTLWQSLTSEEKQQVKGILE